MNRGPVIEKLFNRLIKIISGSSIIVFFIFFMVFFPTDSTSPNYKLFVFLSGLFVNLISSLIIYLVLSIVFGEKNTIQEDGDQKTISVNENHRSEAVKNSLAVLIHKASLSEREKSAIRSELSSIKTQRLITLEDYKTLIDMIDEK
jgi:hypothetical protein